MTFGNRRSSFGSHVDSVTLFTSTWIMWPPVSARCLLTVLRPIGVPAWGSSKAILAADHLWVRRSSSVRSRISDGVAVGWW